MGLWLESSATCGHCSSASGVRSPLKTEKFPKFHSHICPAPPHTALSSYSGVPLLPWRSSYHLIPSRGFSLESLTQGLHLGWEISRAPKNLKRAGLPRRGTPHPQGWEAAGGPDSTLQCDWSAPYSVTDCRKPLGPFQILRKPPLVLPGLLPDQWPQGGRLAAFLLFPSFQGSLLQIVSAWVECRPLQEEQAGQTFNLKQCFKFSLVPRDKAGTLDSLKQGELRAVRRQPSARLSSPCAAKGSCHSSSGSQPLNSEWSSCYLFMSSSFEIG